VFLKRKTHFSCKTDFRAVIGGIYLTKKIAFFGTEITHVFCSNLAFLRKKRIKIEKFIYRTFSGIFIHKKSCDGLFLAFFLH
jgi:ABC-type phosphate/phosphonate transport system permease subunit